MNENTDQELLKLYVGEGVEPAFAELVTRHAGAVYSTAVRLLKDPHLGGKASVTKMI